MNWPRQTWKTSMLNNFTTVPLKPLCEVQFQSWLLSLIIRLLFFLSFPLSVLRFHLSSIINTKLIYFCRVVTTWKTDFCLVSFLKCRPRLLGKLSHRRLQCEPFVTPQNQLGGVRAGNTQLYYACQARQRRVLDPVWPACPLVHSHSTRYAP